MRLIFTWQAGQKLGKRYIHLLTTSLISTFLLLSPADINAQLLYKITRPDIPSASYVLGTHHLAPRTILDSLISLREVVDSTDIIIGELDMTVPKVATAMAMQSYMMAPSDSTLTKLYTPKQMAELDDKFNQYSPLPGVNLYALDNLRPMAVSNLVSVAMFMQTMPDYDPNFQIDSYLQEIYKENGKQIVALETPEYQAELLFTFQPLSVQAHSLAELLNNPDKAIEMTKTLNRAYLAQDIETLRSISLTEDTEPEFVEALVDKRNHAWLPAIVTSINASPCLIVCGALHLTGDNGVLNLLQQEGYIIAPVY
ncbi:MAG: TraB/GumN family protein [Muribaculaceae bacterium]|nr:TraB/GumN family protein [Muribaculaceae bacterium]